MDEHSSDTSVISVPPAPSRWRSSPCHRSWRSISVWLFAAGMVLLAVESVFLGFATNAWERQQAIFWYFASLTVMSFLPGVWLLFSLSFARGNYREFFRMWRWAVGAAFVLPAVLLVFLPGHGISDQRAAGDERRCPVGPFQLRAGGMALYALFLVWSVAVRDEPGADLSSGGGHDALADQVHDSSGGFALYRRAPTRPARPWPRARSILRWPGSIGGCWAWRVC